MDSSITRRRFLTVGAASGVSFAMGLPAPVAALDAKTRAWLTPLYSGEGGTLRDPRVKALVMRVLDTARSSGASYADVYLTYIRSRGLQSFSDEASDSLRIGLSVRALVEGYWGWAATPTLSEAEAVRVGRTAAESARTLAKHGRPRFVELAQESSVQNGEWISPIEVDPFDVSPREIVSFLAGVKAYAQLRPNVDYNPNGEIRVAFSKEERLFASSEQSYCTQTIYNIGSAAVLSNKLGSVKLRTLGKAQAGWEYIRDQPFRTVIPSLLAEIEEEAALPINQPPDVGRYDAVLGADAMRWLLSTTLASATKLDRSIGYDANTLGTTYLGPNVHSTLGTPVASKLVTLIANRSKPKGLATVKWDAEGVDAHEFPLVKDGILVDYQTTREQATWLKDWYAKQGKPIRSNGCAATPEAHHPVAQHTPNLAMTPGAGNASFEDLIAGMTKGIAIHSTAWARTDFQCLNGIMKPARWYEVKNGKRTARYPESSAAAIIFRAPEIWKNITAIGGEKSLEWGEAVGDKQLEYSIGAVPAAIPQLTVVDYTRRA